MSAILRYVLVDRDDTEHDYKYDDFAEAKRAGSEQDCAVIERTYEYNDSDLVWTPDGSSTWPSEEEAD